MQNMLSLTSSCFHYDEERSRIRDLNGSCHHASEFLLCNRRSEFPYEWGKQAKGSKLATNGERISELISSCANFRGVNSSPADTGAHWQSLWYFSARGTYPPSLLLHFILRCKSVISWSKRAADWDLFTFINNVEILENVLSSETRNYRHTAVLRSYPWNKLNGRDECETRSQVMLFWGFRIIIGERWRRWK